MTQEKDYSDSIINAFIDGELDDREKSELISDMVSDQELNDRVMKVRNIRELVQNAYKDIPASVKSQRHVNTNNSRGINLCVAGFVLAVGIVVGWGVQGYLNPVKGLIEFAEITEQNNLINSNEQVARLMIHVTTDDPIRLDIMLNETEQLLKRYEENNRILEMSILTNARGINLVSITTPFAKRLRELTARYSNITFKACKQTLKRLNKDELRNVELLPEAQVVPSALGEVIEKRQQGWSYIRI